MGWLDVRHWATAERLLFECHSSNRMHLAIQSKCPLWKAMPPRARSLLGHDGHGKKAMGTSQFDPIAGERRPWKGGRKVGAKRALKP